MTKNPTPVLLDRLSHALSRHGLKLKRQQLLETAAYAFGCRSSDEFSAAAKNGDIDPPPVVPIGRVVLPSGEAVLIVNDPIANSAYGIDESFVEKVVEDERRETIGVTPYGHLVRLSDLGDAAITDLAAPGGAGQTTELSALVRRAISTIDGYTAEDHEADDIGQIENALHRALEAAANGDANGCSCELRGASTILDGIGNDDAEQHVESTRETIAEAIRAATGSRGADERPLASVVSGLLALVDDEIEKRKEGGDPAAWRDLKRASDATHALLRGALTIPSEGDPESIRISRTDLVNVIGAAESWAEDLETGLADGTYEEDAGIDDVSASIDTLRIRLAMEAPRPVASEHRHRSDTIAVHVGTVSHKHGENLYLGLTRSDLMHQVASYCREEWHEVSDWDDVPENTTGMTDEEVVKTYFSAMSDHEGRESLGTSIEEVAIPGSHPLAITTSACCRCGSGVVLGLCTDETCPFHSVPQDDPRGWAGHPERDPEPKEDGAHPSRPDQSRIEDAPRPADWADRIADALEEGAAADIWFDAHEHGTDDPADPDRIAERRIDGTQQAMIEAARILRELKPARLPDGALMIDGIIPSTQRIAQRADDERHDRLRWITDNDGDLTGNVTITMIASHGLPYHHDRGDSLPLTEKEYEYVFAGEVLNAHLEQPIRLGATVFWQGRKWLAPDTEFGWDTMQEGFVDDAASALVRAQDYMVHVRPMIEALGGQLHLQKEVTDFAHELTILLPFDIAYESASADDWKQALGYLLLTRGEKEDRTRVTCEYTAEMDFGRSVMSVEPEGDTVWDATFDALRWGTQKAVEVLTGESDPDDYAFSPLAPEWVRERSTRHPFTVDPIGLQEALRIAL